ncbi:transposase [Streptomyces turgidiscabies]
MSDAKWAAVRPLLPAPAWLQGRGGQPEGYCHRQLLDAIRYLVAGGISITASAHLPGRRRDRGPFVGKLFAHPFKDALATASSFRSARTSTGCLAGCSSSSSSSGAAR